MKNAIEELETLLTKQVKANKGICYNVSNTTLELIKPLFKEWPLFPGDELLPVPHPTLTPCPAYCKASENYSMWEGEYGENRKALIKFLIERLSQ